MYSPVRDVGRKEFSKECGTDRRGRAVLFLMKSNALDTHSFHFLSPS